MGTDKILFRLVPVYSNSARVLSLKVVPVPAGTVPRCLFGDRLKSFVQTSECDRELTEGAYSLNGAIEPSVKQNQIKTLNYFLRSIENLFILR